MNYIVRIPITKHGCPMLLCDHTPSGIQRVGFLMRCCRSRIDNDLQSQVCINYGYGRLGRHLIVFDALTCVLDQWKHPWQMLSQYSVFHRSQNCTADSKIRMPPIIPINHHLSSRNNHKNIKRRSYLVIPCLRFRSMKTSLANAFAVLRLSQIPELHRWQ